MQKFVKTPLSLVVSTTLLMISGYSHAAGFQVLEHSAAGIGRANSGNGAMADDASVIASNPALMTAFDAPSLSATLTYVAPDVDIIGTKTGGSDASESNVVPDANVPSLFYVHPVNDKLTMGIGVFANFGLKSDYSDEYAGSEFADTASVTGININPSIAYKFSETFSLGFGLNYLLAEAEFVTSLPENMGGTDILSMEGDGTDIGWNIGASWKMSELTTIGLSYRSGFDVDLKGEGSIPSLSVLDASGDLELNLPSVMDLSAAYQYSDSIMLTGSLTYTDWSTFETLEANIEGVGEVHIKDEFYEGAYKLALGGEYQLNRTILLRGGLAYDESPVQEEYRSLSIPDSDRIWYSAGANIKVNQKVDIDFAYTHVDGKQVDVVEESSIGTIFTGTSEGNADLVSVQLNVSF